MILVYSFIITNWTEECLSLTCLNVVMMRKMTLRLMMMTWIWWRCLVWLLMTDSTCLTCLWAYISSFLVTTSTHHFIVTSFIFLVFFFDEQQNSDLVHEHFHWVKKCLCCYGCVYRHQKCSPMEPWWTQAVNVLVPGVLTIIWKCVQYSLYCQLYTSGSYKDRELMSIYKIGSSCRIAVGN